MRALDKFFHLSENQTTVRIEIMAGLTTFLTMAYIIFVQPAVLSGEMFGFQTGMDFGAVTVATCLAAALATAIMALYARYPIAQAPGMGENFFFVFSVLPAAAAAGFTNTWQVGLGVVFVSGVLFLILTLLRVREKLMDAISPSLKNGIAVGIGLFIAFIGLQNAGVILKDPGTAVKFNSHFTSPDLIIFFFGLLVTAVLYVRRKTGAILWGITSATLLTLIFHSLIQYLPADIANSSVVLNSMLVKRFEIARFVLALPPSLAPTFLQMDLKAAFSLAMIPFVIIFLFMNIFDTIGTLIGVGEQAGFIKNNKLPRVKQALLSDAVGTTVGAALGTSTVVSFIESAAGVGAGARTGLAGLVVAGLFLLSLFFSPVIAMVGSFPPITAPALVIVGSIMIQNIKKIDWSDYSESLPAFLTMIGIPLSYSIADGLALGFISYPLIKLFSGRGRDVSVLMYGLAVLLLVYFIFVRSRF